MPGTLKNYYEILGVPRSATADEIRTAYRKLLLKFHPDKNIGDSYFEDWSKKINEAFEVLMSPSVRAEYDQVYDETRAGGSTNSKTDKETSKEDLTEDASPQTSLNADIQKLAPVYISAKHAFIKAGRTVEAIEFKLNQKPINTTTHFILGALLMLTTLLWTAFTQRKWIETSFLQPANQEAGLVNFPLVQQPSNATPSDLITEKVDLWLKVTASKTYFFNLPGEEASGEKFLSRGNKLHATQKLNNYYYGSFQSVVNNNYKIEGWVKMEDVEIVAQ